MNKTVLFQALDQISPEQIAQALDYKPRTRLTLRRGIAFAAAVAAVLALVLGIPFLNIPGAVVSMPGVISVKAFSPDSSSDAFIEKFEGIELEKDTVIFDTHRPWPYFSMYYNFHPGILLSVSVPEEYGDNITYRVVMPTAEYGSSIGKYIPRYHEYDYYHDDEVNLSDLVFQNGDAIACLFGSKEPHEYIHFFLYDGDYIVGYIVVKAYQVPVEGATMGAYYSAELVASAYFPKVNGKRQKVSMDYINKQLAAAIGQE